MAYPETVSAVGTCDECDDSVRVMLWLMSWHGVRWMYIYICNIYTMIIQYFVGTSRGVRPAGIYTFRAFSDFMNLNAAQLRCPYSHTTSTHEHLESHRLLLLHRRLPAHIPPATHPATSPAPDNLLHQRPPTHSTAHTPYSARVMEHPPHFLEELCRGDTRNPPQGTSFSS